MIKQEIVEFFENKDTLKVIIIRYMMWFTNRICINVIYDDIPDVLHSHPWDYFTLILWGGYDETVLIDGKEVTKRRYPGYFSRRKGEDYHRIVTLGTKAITLFIRGPKKNHTNFTVNGKVVRDLKYWLALGVPREQLKHMMETSTIE